jgi:hypothetical protein
MMGALVKPASSNLARSSIVLTPSILADSILLERLIVGSKDLNGSR